MQSNSSSTHQGYHENICAVYCVDATEQYEIGKQDAGLSRHGPSTHYDSERWRRCEFTGKYSANIRSEGHVIVTPPVTNNRLKNACIADAPDLCGHNRYGGTRLRSHHNDHDNTRCQRQHHCCRADPVRTLLHRPVPAIASGRVNAARPAQAHRLEVGARRRKSALSPSPRGTRASRMLKV